MRTLILALATLAACSSAAAALAEPHTRPLQLINHGHDTVTDVAVSAAGQERYAPLPLAAPMRGRGGVAAVAVTGEGCLFDVRVDVDGASRVYRALDLCRYRALRLRPAPRDGEPTALWQPLPQFSAR